jgi:2-polyprenyl-3-methyl-5-hydroxy-6-metoxy-1,4-benzoquinol methylase
MPSAEEALHLIKSTDTEVLYGTILELQTRLCAPEIRAFLKSQETWTTARSLLDAGCGPGEFAYQMKDLIAGRPYLGIDQEKKFLDIARQKLSSHRHFEFQLSDILSFEGASFDCVTLYAVLQHTSSTPATLDALNSNVSEKGGILIFDTMEDGPDISSNHSIPRIERMYSDLREASRANGRNTNCLAEAEIWAKANRFVSSRTESATVISSPESKDIYVQYCSLLSELMGRFYRIDVDQGALIQELMAWREEDTSSVTLSGGAWLVLRRV